MAIPESRQKPLPLVKQQKRILSAPHAYSRLYYDKRREDIDTQWEERVTRDPKLKGNRAKAFSHRNATIRAFLDAETDEVKAEVERRHMADDFSDDEDVEIDDDDYDAIEAHEQLRRDKAHRFHQKVFLHLLSGPFLQCNFLGLKQF